MLHIQTERETNSRVSNDSTTSNPYKSPKKNKNAFSSSTLNVSSTSPEASSTPDAAANHLRHPISTESFGSTSGQNAEDETLQNQQQQDQQMNIMEFLVDHYAGFEMMSTKVKQNCMVSKDVISYLKRRAVIEEEYGKQMLKLSSSMSLHETDVVANRSFDVAWTKLRGIMNEIGKRKVEFAKQTADIGEDLGTVVKDTDRSRKQIKESFSKANKQISEAETQLSKYEAKMAASSEELIRVQNEERLRQFEFSSPAKKQGSFLQGMFAKKEKTEEELWTRSNQDREAYNSQVEQLARLRTEFKAKHQPRLIKSLKECSDETDLVMQAMMLKHINHFEEEVVGEAETLAPLETGSLKSSFANIDHMQDLKSFVNASAARMPRVDTAEKLETNTTATFGQPLSILSAEENNDVPKIVRICVEALQKYGMKTAGLYRVSASPHLVQNLCVLLDKSAAKVHLYEGDGKSDPITVAECLKIFFIKLPDPLLTADLQARFIQASQLNSKKQRLLKVHELINELPDANYITLRYMSKHLLQVADASGDSSIGGLSAVFGPIFVGSHPSMDAIGSARHAGTVLETILDNYTQIFD